MWPACLCPECFPAGNFCARGGQNEALDNLTVLLYQTQLTVGNEEDGVASEYTTTLGRMYGQLITQIARWNLAPTLYTVRTNKPDPCLVVGAAEHSHRAAQERRQQDHGKNSTKPSPLYTHLDCLLDLCIPGIMSKVDQQNKAAEKAHSQLAVLLANTNVYGGHLTKRCGDILSDRLPKDTRLPDEDEEEPEPQDLLPEVEGK